MPDTMLDPQTIARAVACAAAEDPDLVGEFVDAIALDDGVTDFRFASAQRGYEGWQWSVTLYHDEELDRWTVNETSMVPADGALLPPQWVPWKDRLEPTDLSVTDSIGTEADDPRLEGGFRRTEPAEVGSDGATPEEDDDLTRPMQVRGGARARLGDAADAAEPGDGAGETDGTAETADAAGGEAAAGDAAGDEAGGTTSVLDVSDAVEEFDLSRRHVMSPLGRSQTAKRWYEGPRGPKSLSTKTAAGHTCSTCGFFVPLKGELNLLFGVCANKWSPDDGRVVSLDHGCGEHSEIEPPEPTHLWVQSKPAFDDLHIDIIAQAPREESAEIELIERSRDRDEDEATDEDIDANVTAEDDEPEHDDAEGPEVEETLSIADGSDDGGADADAGDSEPGDSESSDPESDSPQSDGPEGIDDDRNEADGEAESGSASDDAETDSVSDGAGTEPGVAAAGDLSTGGEFDMDGGSDGDGDAADGAVAAADEESADEVAEPTEVTSDDKAVPNDETADGGSETAGQPADGDMVDGGTDGETASIERPVEDDADGAADAYEPSDETQDAQPEAAETGQGDAGEPVDGEPIATEAEPQADDATTTASDDGEPAGEQSQEPAPEATLVETDETAETDSAEATATDEQAAA